jgi:omega-amidase
MRATIFQWDVSWMDVETNLTRISDVCRSIAGETDMLVLPEMFNTGYTMEPTQVPQNFTEQTINYLQNISNDHLLTIVGSIPMKRGDHHYNTSIVIRPNDQMSSYDKIHLFKLAGEHLQYTAGHQSSLVDITGWKTQLQVCYDLRFPYQTFNIADKDLIIYCANWPIKRIHHWRQLLIARAIENQCYVIGVNRIGVDANNYEYNGQSLIVDYNGIVVADLGEREGFVTRTLDQEGMKKFRESLPFLGDRI